MGSTGLDAAYMKNTERVNEFSEHLSVQRDVEGVSRSPNLFNAESEQSQRNLEENTQFSSQIEKIDKAYMIKLGEVENRIEGLDKSVEDSEISQK